MFRRGFCRLVWWPLLILLVTGAIMIIGEPARALKNPAFQLKMALLVAALIVTGLFQFLQRRNPAFGEPRSGQRGAAVTIAILSMLLWSSIIFRRAGGSPITPNRMTSITCVPKHGEFPGGD